MSDKIGTTVRGIRAPIITNGDDIVKVVVDSVLEAANTENIKFNDRDVVAVTEAVVARSQGNYATVQNIASDICDKFPEGHIGVIFPILSRNRFAVCLRGIAMGVKKITLMLSYPADEVGNHLIDIDSLDEQNINPWTDVLDVKQFREYFGYPKHVFTGIDYIEFYQSIIEGAGAEAEIIFANNPKAILNYTKNILCCDIHTRARTKRILLKNGAEKVYCLDEVLNVSNDNHGYNEQFGVLGANKATDDKVKLFPRDCDHIVTEIQAQLIEKTGKHLEVLIYGDGAFKDPVGKIWELADPVVSPAFTSGLIGTPNELKLKYLADNDFSKLHGEELREAIKKSIKEKDADLKGTMATQGTTPRQLADLIGSLSDLTSGSGDKGTPIVLIQDYFKNFAE